MGLQVTLTKSLSEYDKCYIISKALYLRFSISLENFNFIFLKFPVLQIIHFSKFLTISFNLFPFIFLKRIFSGAILLWQIYYFLSFLIILEILLEQKIILLFKLSSSICLFYLSFLKK